MNRLATLCEVAADLEDSVTAIRDIIGRRRAPNQLLPMPQSDLPTHVLLVEPDEAARGILQVAASRFAHVESHGRFDTARARVCHGSFDFLVTNIRLDAYNGLHLVYLRAFGPRSPRAIVYSDDRDLGLAREAQRAGAFYETHECLPVTLEAYLHRTLPDRDRRDPASRDRRGIFRGGRRGWDLHLVRQVH